MMSHDESIFKNREYAAKVRRAAQRRRGRQSAVTNLEERVFSLERDLGFVSLLLAAVLETADDKGSITRDEIKQKAQSLDSVDGFRDGGLDLNILRHMVYQMDVGAVLKINNGDEIYYWNEATKADARDLGNLLTNYGTLGGAEGASVDLARTGNQYVLSFILEANAIDDPEVVEYYQRLGEKVADGRFGYPLSIDLCDDMMQVLKTLKIEEP